MTSNTNLIPNPQGRESHLVFTLHIYQYLSNGQGGRSRLHLIDFGGCERTKVSSNLA